MNQSLLNTREAADRLGLRKSTLDCWRSRGGGPAYRKIGAAVRYSVEDLERFVQAAVRTSTSDPGNVERIGGGTS